jgi:hypothetical protein
MRRWWRGKVWTLWWCWIVLSKVTFNDYVDTILPFFDPLPTSTWTFVTLDVDKYRHVWTPDQPLLVHVAIERPLRRSRDDIATRRCRFHKKQIEPKKSNVGKVRGLPGQYSREFADQSCQIFCQFEGHHPYLRSHLTTHLLHEVLIFYPKSF